MSDIEALERRVLAEARGQLGPDDSDAERVRARLTAALAAPSTVTLNDAQGSGVFVKMPWARSLLAVGVGVGLGFGAGYYAGQQSAPTRLATGAATLAERVRDPLAVQRSDLGTERASPIEGNAEFERAREDAKATGTSSTGRPQGDAQSSRSRHPSLHEELGLVRRAESAVRAHNPLLARALLKQLDEEYPRGALREERAAIRAMAQCQELGNLEDRERIAEDYLRRFPKSVYEQRLISQCGAARGDSTD